MASTLAMLRRHSRTCGANDGTDCCGWLVVIAALNTDAQDVDAGLQRAKSKPGIRPSRYTLGLSPRQSNPVSCLALVSLVKENDILSLRTMDVFFVYRIVIAF
jgi:hypothetical protein